MLVPIKWLKDYTKVDVDINEFTDRMIMSGSNLETVEKLPGEMRDVVVGKINKAEKHPLSDRLSLCMVDVGKGEDIKVVCGAPNVEEGILVPVCLPGGHIPGPLHGQAPVEGGVDIQAGEVKGETSNGVICSCGELGYDDKVVPVAHREGIWILPTDIGLEPGMDFAEAMDLDDFVVDFEITPNRPDCLCMTGMARESAATFKESVDYPATDTKCEAEGTAADYIQVNIQKPEFCTRYYARVATDIKIEQSPWWMQQRLMHAGMRPINNIVDLTNFVMLEYGQPLHAFDIRTVKGGVINVDTAEPGSTFTTLDEKERTMPEDVLMIKDAEEPIGIAGIMGGLDSEITDDTTTILIEGANFNGDNIRLSAKALGLRTEASSRFEKGIDPNQASAAVDRVCHLIEELGYGKVVKGAVDNYPGRLDPWTVDVRVARVNKIIGDDIPKDEMIEIFKSLEIEVEDAGDGILRVTPPTIRLDLVEEIDFVEEVARIHGYDKLPMTLPKGSACAGEPRNETIRNMTRIFMVAMGANEIQTYSFVSPQDADRVRLPEDAWERDAVVLLNPLGEENSVMRTILSPSMLQVLGRNYSKSIDSVRAFEIGTVFTKNEFEPSGLPNEYDSMCIGIYGEGNDFFMLKGIVCELLSKLGIEDVRFVAEKEHGTYHPGRCARFMTGPEEDPIELGIMGEVHPDVAETYGIGTRACLCELFFDKIEDLAKTETRYVPLPKYPAITRDVAVTVDEDVAVGAMEEAITGSAGELLESVQLFDIYRGEQIDEGKKSVAFSLIYRDRTKTLTDAEVDAAHEKVVLELKDKFNAVLREI
ncbi:MAG: phenylalanine--tRNA ligase subunit beta [Firmicutes bacterium]|nr:phenylalanine--tRNA ligase subunit beta [Bacillota bacterium]